DGQADAGARAGKKHAGFVVHFAAHLDRSRGRIDAVVHEIQRALMWIVFFAVKGESEFSFLLLYGRQHLGEVLIGSAQGFRIALQRALIDRKIQINGVDGTNGGQERIAAAGVDQVPFSQLRLADAAGDRSGDTRVLQVQLTAFDLFLGRVYLG